MSERTPSLEDIKHRVIEKATADQVFRNEVLATPRAAIRREFGVEFPGELDVQVVEESWTRVWIVLPAPPPREDGEELSDAELGKVAGGKGIIQKFHV